MAKSVSNSSAFPFEWLRNHLVNDILPHWLDATVTENGFFWPQLDRQWQRRSPGFATLVSQSRLVSVFSIGYAITGEKAYREAAAAGADFLLRAFDDRIHGGWHWSCDPEGKLLDEKKDCYGHAFAIYGLAHAYRATKDSRYRKAAERTWDVVDSRFRDKRGGLVWHMTADFRPMDSQRSQNPMMHMFEALTELADAAGDRSGRSDGQFILPAQRIADFLFLPIADNDLPPLPEIYDLEWTPVPSAAGVGAGGDPAVARACPVRSDTGGYSAGGHLFEWAFLLSMAVERGMDAAYMRFAERCLRNATDLAYDREHPGVITQVSLEGKPVNYAKSFWEPCEAIRALLHFAVRHGRTDLLPACRDILGFVQQHFVDPEHGGFYANLTREGAIVNAVKGSEWKVDYHTTGMCAEAIRK